jgi:hypothetical protein
MAVKVCWDYLLVPSWRHSFMSRCLYILGSLSYSWASLSPYKLNLHVQLKLYPSEFLRIHRIGFALVIILGHGFRLSCSRDLAISLSFSCRWDIIFPIYSVRFYFIEVG